jgi:polyisoprenoid-binding protein YceI
MTMDVQQQTDSRHTCLAPRLRFLLSIFIAITAQATFAQTPQFQPGEINVEHSRVFIFVDKSGPVGHQHAIEGKLKSGMLFPKVQERGTLTFDMTSFDADTKTAREYLGLKGETDESTREKVNGNMLGSEVLDVKRFPTATFENVVIEASNTTSKRSLPEYILVGDFTLHGKTQQVKIKADLEEKDGWYHLRGGFRIKQSDFGIKPFSKMMGAIGVADPLIIMGDIWIAPK